MASENDSIINAIQAVRKEIRWKSGSAGRHLQKRKARGHLPETATIVDYEQVVSTVVNDKSAQVYRYWYNRASYVTIVATVLGRQWLVMFSYDGVLESAFVIERPEHYLSKPGFEPVGLLGEVNNEL